MKVVGENEPMQSSKGKHIVVTGGAGGLGLAVVRAFLATQATVHVPRFETEPGADDPLEGRARVMCQYKIDLSDEQQAVRYFAGLPPLWGSIHLAGGFSMASIAETTAADLNRMFTLNAVSSFLASREAVKRMRLGGTGGRIVNVAARPAIEPTAGMTAYAMSKAAVAALTQTMARELVGEGILVNAIVPSIIDTLANRAAMPDADHDSWPTPEQLANAIVYLVSEANSLTTGALLPVYGRA